MSLGMILLIVLLLLQACGGGRLVALPEDADQSDRERRATSRRIVDLSVTVETEAWRGRPRRLTDELLPFLVRIGLDPSDGPDPVHVAEAYHEARYLKLLGNIKSNLVFERDQEQTWRCQNCGYQHEGTEAPDECPACNHPQAHFELKPENY